MSNRPPIASLACLEPLEPRLLLTSDWTVMVFLDGDCNLEPQAIKYGFLELASVGSTPNVNVVVEFDRSNQYSTEYGDWTDTRRGLVQKGDVPDTNWGVSIGEVNMGDPSVLAQFVNWAAANYPADKYALVLDDHGSGLSVVSDEESNDCLWIGEVRTALNSASVGVDLLAMFACSMGTIESAYEVAGNSSVYVACQGAAGVLGTNYLEILTDLTAHPTYTASQLGAEMVELSFNNMSAIDSSKMGALAAGLSSFCDIVMTKGTYADLQRLRTHRCTTSTAWYRISDMGTFLTLASEDGSISATVRQAAASALLAFDGAMIAHKGHDGSGGLDFYYFPDPTAGAYPFYMNSSLKFLQDTLWDEFLLWWQSAPRAPSFYVDTIDSATGWTLEGDWGFGQPTGSMGDPSSGNTGTNVIGYNLEGGYGPMTTAEYAVLGPINCTGRTHVLLEYYRWLGVAQPPYGHASLQVSNDGTNWSDFWTEQIVCAGS